MPRAARRYDIFLPLNDNDGSPFPDQHFDSVERRLLKRFGGVTSQQREFPYRGIWRSESQLYFDQVVVVTVLDFRPRGSARFVASLKRELRNQFRQLEILITESALKVH